MDIEKLQIELTKMHPYGYHWGRKQCDDWDAKCRFIYDTHSFDELLVKIDSFDQPLKNYAMVRWYNFHSAQGVEYAFSQHPSVVPNLNEKDKMVDFTIDGMTFDHKTSVFPRGFQHSLEFAQANPRKIIQWLYESQSQGGRMHNGNRLFVIVHEENGQHWKIKANMARITRHVDKYMLDYSIDKLYCRSYTEEDGSSVYSDIIWIT